MNGEPLGAADALQTLLHPRGVAVVGVSNRESNVALRFTRALTRHGFQGALSVVNRSGEDVEGLPGYTSLLDVPDPVDLAVIAVQAEIALDAIDLCGERGIPTALVFSSGFAEVGPEGTALQEALLERARRAGVRLLGPNCVGFANVRDGVCPMASGFAFREHLESGELAVISQSGGVGGLVGERAQDLGIGLSYIVSTGNEADLSAADALEFFVAKGIKQIGLYLEAVRHPQRLADALCEASAAGCGVAVFKAGTGERTSAAAAAHTGSLVGDDASFDALCRQVGVCRVNDLDEIFLVPPILAAMKGGGPRVGVLSTSGGAAVAVADACERVGLELPELSDATAVRVAEDVPGFASRQNPIDISGMFVVEMSQFRRALGTLTTAPDFDAVLVVQTVHPPALAEQIADVVIAGASPSSTVVVWAAGSQSLAARTRLRRAGFAVSESPHAVAVAVAAATSKAGRAAPALVFSVKADAPARTLRPSALLERLGEAGVAVAPMAHVETAADAAEAAERLGFPVVLKADAADMSHKTEQGAVVVGLASRDAVLESYVRLESAGVMHDGALIQKAVRGQRELLVTARRDPVFGLVAAVGFGGVLTEAIGRAAVLLPPVTEDVLAQTLTAAGLDSYVSAFRGEQPLHLKPLLEIVRGVLEVADQFPEALHLELNPVIVDAIGMPVAVDALLDLGMEK